MSVPVTVKVLSLSLLAAAPLATVLSIVIRALWLAMVFNTPTLTVAAGSTADGITDVTVPNILVVCFVAAPVNISASYQKRASCVM